MTHFGKRNVQVMALFTMLAVVATAVPIAASAQSATLDVAQECGLNYAASYLNDQIFGSVSNAVDSAKDELVGAIAGAVPVRDAKTQAAVKTGSQKITFETCFRAVKEAIFKVALAKFKKRLLDSVTDRIITWINGDGNPKFFSNFEGVLSDAAQAAVGDTAREVGLANLCEPLRLRIPPLLTPVPKFSQSVSCTLDKIVANIDGFYQDFSTGGFLAYAEMWKPQNNAHGLFLKINDEIVRKAAEKETAASLVATAGGGYVPIRRCLQWTATSYAISLGRSKEKIYSTSDFLFSNFKDPTVSPSPDSAAYKQAETDLGGGPITFVCSQDQITIPPGGTQQIAGQAFAGDTQYIASADDLTPYISAIFDAATNRVIKWGVDGLRRNLPDLQSESGTGRTPEPYPTGPEGDRYRGYGGEYGNSQNLSSQLKTRLQSELASAKTEAAALNTHLTSLIALSNELVATTTDLSDCETTSLGAICSDTNAALSAATAQQIQLVGEQANLAQTIAALNDAGVQITANPDMSEGEISSLLATITNSRTSFATAETRYAGLETTIGEELRIKGLASQECSISATYSCGWTPPGL